MSTNSPSLVTDVRNCVELRETTFNLDGSESSRRRNMRCDRDNSWYLVDKVQILRPNLVFLLFYFFWVSTRFIIRLRITQTDLSSSHRYATTVVRRVFRARPTTRTLQSTPNKTRINRKSEEQRKDTTQDEVLYNSRSGTESRCELWKQVRFHIYWSLLSLFSSLCGSELRTSQWRGVYGSRLYEFFNIEGKDGQNEICKKVLLPDRR